MPTTLMASVETLEAFKSICITNEVSLMSEMVPVYVLTVFSPVKYLHTLHQSEFFVFEQADLFSA